MRFPTSTRPLINLPVRGVGLLGLALVVSCSGLEDDSLTEPRFEGVVPPHITKDPGAAPDHTAPVDDIAPEPIIGIVNPDGSNNQQCGRLGGVQFKTFLVNGSDETRSGTTPRSWLQYRVQLRANSVMSCTQHLADPFTAWEFFPDGSEVPVLIGDSPPTLYNDLFPPGCSWTFRLQVRDPAGNVAETSCVIEQR